MSPSHRYNNILVVRSDEPFCIIPGHDEARILARCFRSRSPYHVVDSWHLQIYDIDRSYLSRMDEAFEDFSIRIARMDTERGDAVRRFRFQSRYYELVRDDFFQKSLRKLIKN